MRKGRRGWISLRMLTSDLRTGAADRDVETPASMPGMLEPGNLNVTALVGRPRRGLGRPRRGLGAASPGSGGGLAGVWAASPGSGRPRRGLGGLAGVWAASPGSGLVFGVQVECGRPRRGLALCSVFRWNAVSFPLLPFGSSGISVA